MGTGGGTVIAGGSRGMDMNSLLLGVDFKFCQMKGPGDQLHDKVNVFTLLNLK